jgi:hypothetical protein
LGLNGVPGFFKVEGMWVLVDLLPGILIPIRNFIGQIVGVQIRHDDPASIAKYLWLSSANRTDGTSSGAPLHWARPELLVNSSEVLLTEGALKGDLISHFLSVPVIAAAGVGLFGRDFATDLKRAYPNLKGAICFDSDWRTKPQVLCQLESLQKQLTQAGIVWTVRCWGTDFKGYDDYLAATRSGEVAA